MWRIKILMYIWHLHHIDVQTPYQAILDANRFFILERMERMQNDAEQHINVMHNYKFIQQHKPRMSNLFPNGPNYKFKYIQHVAK